MLLGMLGPVLAALEEHLLHLWLRGVQAGGMRRDKLSGGRGDLAVQAARLPALSVHRDEQPLERPVPQQVPHHLLERRVIANPLSAAVIEDLVERKKPRVAVPTRQTPYQMISMPRMHHRNEQQTGYFSE